MHPDLSDPSAGHGGTYGVILLYRGPQPDLRSEAWLAALPTQVDATPTACGDWLLADHRHPMTVKDRTIPALSVVVACPVPDAEARAAALSQTWTWPGAADAVADVRSAVYVGEMTGRALPREQRLATLLPVISGIVRATRADAVLWLPADYLVEPGRVRDHARDVLVNVRRFRIEGTPGGVLVDTMGLASLGLPDLQCKVWAVEPGWITAELRNLGGYLLEYGDVLRDGQVVAGADRSVAWRVVSRSRALAEPARPVLDLAPVPRQPT